MYCSKHDVNLFCALHSKNSSWHLTDCPGVDQRQHSNVTLYTVNLGRYSGEHGWDGYCGGGGQEH